jgi:hypothetical protein
MILPFAHFTKDDGRQLFLSLNHIAGFEEASTGTTWIYVNSRQGNSKDYQNDLAFLVKGNINHLVKNIQKELERRSDGENNQTNGTD